MTVAARHARGIKLGREMPSLVPHKADFPSKELTLVCCRAVELGGYARGQNTEGGVGVKIFGDLVHKEYCLSTATDNNRNR